MVINKQKTSGPDDPRAKEWYWVLTTPVTIHRDAMMVLENEEGDFVPVFRDREEAAGFLARLAVSTDSHAIQAMHYYDIMAFVEQKKLSAICLDSFGHVLDFLGKNNHNVQ